MLKKLLVLPALLLLLTTSAHADPCNLDDPDFNPDLCNSPSGPTGPPVGAPIDGGASILLGSGIAIAAKKIRDSRKNKK
jgi:hypothetical protein